MARKPNYRADRIERDRAKAAKKAKRAEARAEKSAKNRGELPDDDVAAPDPDNPEDTETSAIENPDD